MSGLSTTTGRPIKNWNSNTSKNVFFIIKLSTRTQILLIFLLLNLDFNIVIKITIANTIENKVYYGLIYTLSVCEETKQIREVVAS